jgi:small subunit ribosomal protein S1
MIKNTETAKAVKENPKETKEVENQNPSKENHKKTTKPKEGGKKEGSMGALFAAAVHPPKEGDLVEGVVTGIKKASIFVDLPPFGTGIIYGREYQNARDVIKKIRIGDLVTAKVLEPENDSGYIELSLREARQALIWNEAETAIKEKKIFELTVKDANKGGLIIDWQGISGFLPASQLKPEHYPRVEGGDKDKIIEELKKLVGTKLAVSIITALPKENKLIFSEKTLEEKEKIKIVEKFHLGEELTGVVTGVVDFGVFVKVEEGLEGLVHISEIDWGLVEDPRKMVKVGEEVKVKIIDIKDGKISLSIKALKKNPWIEAAEKYKKGDIVKGVIIKFNKHGALASIEEGVAGLIHLSDFGGSEEALRSTLELGKSYNFKISIFEPKEMKMVMSWKEANPQPVK